MPKSVPKSNTKAAKIIDVKQPGTAPADASSRPLIVTNRPVLKDPMFVDTMPPAAEAMGAAPARAADKPAAKKIRIEPLHVDLPAGLDDVDGSAPAALEPKTAKKLKAAARKRSQPAAERAQVKQTAQAAPASPAKTLTPSHAWRIEPVESAKPLELTRPPQQTTADPVDDAAPVGDVEADRPANPPLTPGDKASKTTEAAKPEKADHAVKTEPGTAAETSPVSASPGAEALPPARDESPGLDLGGDTASADPHLDSHADAHPDSQAAREARAAAEQQKAVEKLIEDGTYVLPVNRLEKRRTRHLLLILLAIVLLGIVWLDLALDSGLLKLHGIQPLTNFFATK